MSKIRAYLSFCLFIMPLFICGCSETHSRLVSYLPGESRTVSVGSEMIGWGSADTQGLTGLFKSSKMIFLGLNNDILRIGIENSSFAQYGYAGAGPSNPDRIELTFPKITPQEIVYKDVKLRVDSVTGSSISFTVIQTPEGYTKPS